MVNLFISFLIVFRVNSSGSERACRVENNTDGTYVNGSVGLSAAMVKPSGFKYGRVKWILPSTIWLSGQAARHLYSLNVK